MTDGGSPLKSTAGQELSIELIERIRAEYRFSGGRIRAVARSLNVSPASVRKYGPNPNDSLAQLRTEKAAELIPSIMDEIAAAQRKILRAIASDDKIKGASFQELTVGFGILTDKHQLLTGEATERHEHRDADSPRADLARRIDELAERRRAQAPTGQSVGSGSG